MKIQKKLANVLLVIFGLLIIGGGAYLYLDNERSINDDIKNIEITQPRDNETYQQGESIYVSWQTNELSENELLLGFVDINNSVACDSQQIIDPYLKNGVPINSNEFGTSMYIGGPGSPGGACVLDPDQYKIRLCERNPITGEIKEESCAFSPIFTVLEKKNAQTENPNPNKQCVNIKAVSFNENKINPEYEIIGIVDNTLKNCSWGKFEGQAGTAQLYFYSDDKWKPIGQQSIIDITDEEWMTEISNFQINIGFDNKNMDLSSEPLKIVLTEEDPKDGVGHNTFEIDLPF